MSLHHQMMINFVAMMQHWKDNLAGLQREQWQPQCKGLILPLSSYSATSPQDHNLPPKVSYLEHPVTARFLRLHVQTWHQHPSLRMEILGCQGEHQVTWLGSKTCCPQSATRLSARYRSPRWRRLATRTAGRDITLAGTQRPSSVPLQFKFSVKTSSTFLQPLGRSYSCERGLVPKAIQWWPNLSYIVTRSFGWLMTLCSQITSGCRWTWALPPWSTALWRGAGGTRRTGSPATASPTVTTPRFGFTTRTLTTWRRR